MTSHFNASSTAARGATARVGRGLLALGIALASAGVLTPASAGPLGDAVVNYARAHMSQCVEGNGVIHPSACPALAPGAVGPGECTQLPQAALAALGALPPVFRGAMPPNMLRYEYVWGTPVNPPYQPGDIIQFWFYSTTSPSGAKWWTSRGHTAIIAQAHPGGMLNLLEQNNGVRAVTARWLDLDWPHTGWYFVYRPQPRSPLAQPANASMPPVMSRVTSHANPAMTNVFRR
jgi:hypothetical protein